MTTPLVKPAAIETAITKMFNIDYPIIGAPMFLVSNEDMVVAASESGGMGSFPALNYRPIENYRKAIQAIKSRTKGPFGINIIMQQSNKFQDEHIDIALEEGVALIISSLGSPKKILQRAQGTNTKVFCDVIGLTHAKKAADAGAHGLIAVGSGAGGHGGDISPFALIPYLKKHIQLPLVAAGSISDGKGMLASLALGADGIYMGTRIIASKESAVNEPYKKAIVDSSSEDIVNTDRVDGFPGNFIKTQPIAELLQPNLVDNVLSYNKRLKRWVSLMRAGKVLFGSQDQKLSYKNVFSAGHGVAAIDSILSIEEIFYSTVQEYHDRLKSLPR
jgi:nitronate monooxygenase